MLRILILKIRLIPEFQIDSIITAEENLLNIGLGDDTAYQVTRNAATLISPKIDQLAITLPDEPAKNDRMIIFTDTLSVSQCASCAPQDIVSVNELQNVIAGLYGKTGSGQIQEGNIISYPFLELQDFVQNPFNGLDLESNLSRANWVISSLTVKIRHGWLQRSS